MKIFPKGTEPMGCRWMYLLSFNIHVGDTGIFLSLPAGRMLSFVNKGCWSDTGGGKVFSVQCVFTSCYRGSGLACGMPGGVHLICSPPPPNKF